MRKNIIKILLLLSSMLATIFLVELFVGKYYKERYVPYSWIYLDNGEWNIDRNFIFITQKVEDRIRELSRYSPDKLVITLGDSFTQGDPVDEKDNYPSQLQSLFSLEDDGNEMSVVNLGVGGYGPDQELKLLHSALEQGARPKIVVWQFFPNDIYENLAQATYTIDAQNQLKAFDVTKNWIFTSQTLYEKFPLPKSIKENSRLVNYLLSYSLSQEYSSVPAEHKGSYEAMEKWAVEKLKLEVASAEELAKKVQLYSVLRSDLSPIRILYI